MSIPKLSINFKAKAETLSFRSRQGALMLILRGAVPAGNPVCVIDEADISASVSAANKEYIKMALKGNDKKPKAVYAYFLTTDGDVEQALEWAAAHKIDYISMPTAETDEATEVIKTWVIAQKQFGNYVCAVLPNTAGDSEYIINYITDSVKVGNNSYTAEQFTPRIAGILCGTENTHSVTFASIDEAEDCTRMTEAEMISAQTAGKLFCVFDGEKVKLSRGINSLITVPTEKNESFKKIKYVSVMSAIRTDLKTLCEDNYIGKFANTYNNRCLLLSAIQDYFDELSKQDIVSKAEISFDLEAIKSAMQAKGINYSDMTDEEIKRVDIDSKVFLCCNVKILDAIEDISFDVEI